MNIFNDARGTPVKDKIGNPCQKDSISAFSRVASEVTRSFQSLRMSLKCACFRISETLFERQDTADV